MAKRSSVLRRLRPIALDPQRPLPTASAVTLTGFSYCCEQVRQQTHATETLVVFEHPLPHHRDDLDRIKARHVPWQDIAHRQAGIGEHAVRLARKGRIDDLVEDDGLIVDATGKSWSAWYCGVSLVWAGSSSSRTPAWCSPFGSSCR